MTAFQGGRFVARSTHSFTPLFCAWTENGLNLLVENVGVEAGVHALPRTAGREGASTTEEGIEET